MKSRYHLASAILIPAIVFVVSGCDALKAIGEYFGGDKNKVESSAEPASKTEAPVVTKPASTVPADAIIAVDEWSLTSDEFQKRLDALKQVAPDFDISNPDNKKAIVEELINQQLLVKEAENLGLSSNSEITAAVDEFRRTLLIRQLATTLTENLTVSDEDVAAFYEEQKQYMVTPMAWRIRAIIVESKEEANSLLSKILAGDDFAETAKAHSKLPGAAENGGDVGYLTAEQMPFPELVNEVATLRVGDVGKVFQGPDGFYIIKVEDIQGGEVLSLEDVQQDIRDNLLLQKQQEFMLNHAQELRNKAKIIVNENLL